MLGIVWIYAALHKASDAREAIIAMSWGLGVTFNTAWILLHGVVLVEWILGVLLLLGLGRRGAPLASLILLLAYSLFLSRLLMLDAPVGCGCGFGSIIKNASNESSLALGLVRNILLMACVIIVIRAVPSARPVK